ncbi:MAG: tyrosine--tRNA ligase, partial [Buchnera aphidicola]|nr:tyrosine--tRNA ligase [Buchnera aphidicola]
KLSESRSRAKNMIISGSILINMKKIVTQKYIFNKHDKLFNQFTLLTRGKKHHILICWKNTNVSC